ncbi:mini-ribonuclease 3-like protein [Clostridia bacterium]|nr:mini-ribonuclease 3-like protein [Clostridia bacterium]
MSNDAAVTAAVTAAGDGAADIAASDATLADSADAVRAAKRYSGIELAFIGDCVYELYARQRVLDQKHFQKKTTDLVRASYQSQACERLLPLLTETEAEIFRRGKNSNPKTIPKGCTQAEYRRATALEAVFGFLRLTGQDDRAAELFARVCG